MRLFVLYIMNNHSSLGIRIKFFIRALSCLDEENRSLYYYYVFCFVRGDGWLLHFVMMFQRRKRRRKKKKTGGILCARGSSIIFTNNIESFFFLLCWLSIRGSTPPHSADLTVPHAVVIHSASPIFPSIKETRTVFYRLCV